MTRTLTLTVVLLVALTAGCKTLELAKTAAKEAAVRSGAVTRQQVDSAERVAEKTAKIFESFTPMQEHYIGRAVGAELLGRYEPLNARRLTRYINVLGQTIAAVSDKPDVYVGYRFLVLDTDEVNGFASPGGLIFVTRGLLDCCTCEDDLAAVLAHEIAHVQLAHGVRAIKKGRFSGAVGAALAEGAKTWGPEQVGLLADALEGTVSDVTDALTSGYDKGWEYEADACAVELLERLGYDPLALSSVFEAMAKKVSDADESGFGHTHPKVSARIGRVRERVGADTERQSAENARTKRFKAATTGL